jgi:hypothetical protein
MPRLELEMETFLRGRSPKRNYIGIKKWGIVVILLRRLEEIMEMQCVGGYWSMESYRL